MGLACFWLAATAVATPVKIEHEEMLDSTNATRLFSIRLKNVAADTPLQPTVMYRFHDESQQLLLAQDDNDTEVFSAYHTFDGVGKVEYIITAGNVFWTPENASSGSFATFEQLQPPTTTTPTTSTTATSSTAEPHVARHVIGIDEDTGSAHYHVSYTGGFFLWFALALIIFSFIFFGLQ